MKEVCLQDYEYIISDSNITWNNIDNSTIFVTGATGLIGLSVVKALLYYSKKSRANVKLVCLVRNKEKAETIYDDFLKDGCNIEFILGNITEKIYYNGNIDYIIHGASATSSRMFVERPVDIIEIAIKGTDNVLKFAQEKNVKAMTYLSSMEVYGTPNTDEKIDENNYKYMDHFNVRSSYPEGKKMVECLCKSYFSQYKVPVNVVRLTQTFGPEVDYNDGRVFADFARCLMEKRDIILHTNGKTKRSYLYTADAVRAILTVLLRGIPGEAYNAANEDTYCSIFEMASMVAGMDETGSISVRIEVEDESRFGYLPNFKMNLDTDKLRQLGWKANIKLKDMFTRMIKFYEKEV